MASWLYIVAVLVFGAPTGFCISCYSCSSMTNKLCLRPDGNNVPLKNCTMHVLNETKVYAEEIDHVYSKLFQLDIHIFEPQVLLQCLKQVTKVGNKMVVIRGCQPAPSDNWDICDRVKKVPNDTLLTTHCSLCNSYACNSALRNQPKLLGFEKMIAILIVTFKLLLW